MGLRTHINRRLPSQNRGQIDEKAPKIDFEAKITLRGLFFGKQTLVAMVTNVVAMVTIVVAMETKLVTMVTKTVA